jgi:hypothetical protein
MAAFLVAPDDRNAGALGEPSFGWEHDYRSRVYSTTVRLVLQRLSPFSPENEPPFVSYDRYQPRLLSILFGAHHLASLMA